MHQLPSFNDKGAEWAIDRILSHSGQGTDSMFEVQWTTGNITWATYHKMHELNCLKEYFEAMGITGVRALSYRTPPQEHSVDESQLKTKQADSEKILTLHASAVCVGLG